MSVTAPPAPRAIHLSRLKSIWRSAGWPCRDAIELDLIAAAWVAPERDGEGRETLRLTETGLQLLAEARMRRTRSASAHDRLAARVCSSLVRQGRIVWRELSLRARVTLADAKPATSPPSLALDFGSVPTTNAAADVSSAASASAWRMARPDLFSIRSTSVPQYLHPVVHEIKATRADLLADLRNPAKRDAYRWLSCETYYVFPAEVAEADEIPEEFGVLAVQGSIDEGTLALVRPAHHAPCTLPFAVWMALAKSTPMHDEDVDPPQTELIALSHDERT